MKDKQYKVVEFVGGPVDGRKQSISCENGLGAIIGWRTMYAFHTYILSWTATGESFYSHMSDKTKAAPCSEY